MRGWNYLGEKNQKCGQTHVRSTCPSSLKALKTYQESIGWVCLERSETECEPDIQKYLCLVFKKISCRLLQHTSQQVLKSQGLCSSYHCTAITQPIVSAWLTSQAASLSLTEMLVLSQRNKENILTGRECLSGFSWCGSGEIFLFLSVQWGPVGAGVCPWPLVMRFK